MSDKFNNKLRDVKRSFELALSELKVSMYNSRINPGNEALRNQMTADQELVENAKVKLFEMKNEVHQELEKLEEAISKSDRKVDELKVSNNKLIKEKQSLENSDEAAEPRLVNTERYQQTTMYGSLFLLLISLAMAHKLRS